LWLLKPSTQLTIHVENFIDDQECQEIFDWANNIEKFEDAAIGDNNQQAAIDHTVRNTNIKWLMPGDKTQNFFKKLTDFINHVNENNFHYDLTYIEALQFGKYDSADSQFYGPHVDCHWHYHQRKLSVIIFLNDRDDFTGGELMINLTGTLQKMNHKKNSILVFPSFLVHEVKPVLSGVRYSLVTWVNGPRFR
jgi:PKHD-type hydroxylase